MDTLDTANSPQGIQWLLQNNINGDPIAALKKVEAGQPFVPIIAIPAFVLRALNRPNYDVTLDAMHWAGKLGFEVDPAYVRPLLIKSGAWSVEEVMGYTDNVLNGIVLWLACREFMIAYDQGHQRPFAQVYDLRLHTR